MEMTKAHNSSLEQQQNKMESDASNSNSLDHVSTSADDATIAPEEDRDEVKEVKKHAARDTAFVRTWRLVVTGVLLATALAVTFTTHHFLQMEDHRNFHEAVSSSICSLKQPFEFLC
jgi:hypothetical protein